MWKKKSNFRKIELPFSKFLEKFAGLSSKNHKKLLFWLFFGNCYQKTSSCLKIIVQKNSLGAKKKLAACQFYKTIFGRYEQLTKKFHKMKRKFRFLHFVKNPIFKNHLRQSLFPIQINILHPPRENDLMYRLRKQKNLVSSSRKFNARLKLAFLASGIFFQFFRHCNKEISCRVNYHNRSFYHSHVQYLFTCKFEHMDILC